MVDDPLWSTMMPPNGWGCKCRVRQLSQKEADGLGGEKAPDIEWVKSTAPQTGDTVDHIQGIDPEWSYNPGDAPRRA